MYPLRRYLFRLGVLILIPILFFTIYYVFNSTTSISSDIVLSDAKPMLPPINNFSSEIVLNDAKSTLQSINNFSSTSTERQIDIPDIFDLSLWRHVVTGGVGNQTQCIVPIPYRAIADAYCAAHNRGKCPMLPCTLIYHTNEFTKNIECLRGGKPAIGVKPDWICRMSPALELFSNSQKKPSIKAEAFTTLTAELYGEALAPYRDHETSKWGMTLEGESIGYYPSAGYKKRVIPLFDITIGYDRRIFDLIKNLYLPDYIHQILNTSNRLTVKEVLRNKVIDHAPILWINGNCDTPSNRSAYMSELMRYIRVDALGKCGNPNWNKSLVSSDPNVLVEEKLNLSKQYLFTIAIENSLEHDYVTEKLWQPLAVGSVPIYLGAPNIDDWLPCTNYSCIINLRQFSSVYEAANFINKIAKDRKSYTQYHQWRNEENLRPSFVSMANYIQEAKEYSIECLICDMVHRNDHGAIRRKLLAADNPFNNTFPSLI